MAKKPEFWIQRYLKMCINCKNSTLKVYFQNPYIFLNHTLVREIKNYYTLFNIYFQTKLTKAVYCKYWNMFRIAMYFLPNVTPNCRKGFSNEWNIIFKFPLSALIVLGGVRTFEAFLGVSEWKSGFADCGLLMKSWKRNVIN